ncbi:MAG: nascent polypeptide-associated complex protein [Methanomicrobiales archaeon]|nr:nascent polypeptide-associated complex protein [Methanomicrobiales archaeon]
MIPGMNPKKMKQMMKQLGMKMDTIENVERVIVYTAQGRYVFEPAEVIATTMQGVTTYQLNGEPRFEPAEIVIPEEDIALVMEQAGVSRESAESALKEAAGDIADAILKLTGA